MVLSKRENYRRAFKDFDLRKVARFNRRSVERLLRDEGLVRNRLKVESTVNNARMILKVQDEHGSFDRYIWQFTGGEVKGNSWRSWRDIPAITEESKTMSKDLLRRGFRFVGPTICYAFMQAAGMVDDHERDCFRHGR